MKDLLKPKVRKYVYRVGIATLALLYAKGVITEGDVLSMEPLLAAVLGLADANVTEPDTEE